MNKLWLTAIVLAGCLCACKKVDFDDTAPGTLATKAAPVTVILDESLPGYTIPHIFEGLSYETDLLTNDPGYLNENNTVLIRLLKNLGKGVLRIGGNSSDEVEWGGADAGTDTLHRKLTTADIDRLAAFAKAVNWPVLFGLNLADNNPGLSANEAAYVSDKLQNNLYAFQTGNEPDFFGYLHRPAGYRYSDYQHEWDGYYAAVKNKVPYARFAGPDVTPFNLYWLSEFSKNTTKRIVLLDGHYYNNGPASNPAISLTDVLTPNSKMAPYLQGMSAIAGAHGVPYRISEGNSIWGQGKPGVSNVFASALWALDFMWRVAENKGQGINFHGGGIRFVYTPINTTNGITTVRPLYYAMLAFKYGATGGKIIPARVVNPDGSSNYSVHACINPDKSTSVTIINKELAKDFVFTVQLHQPASAIHIDRLTAPSVTSVDGVSFAGSTVSADGSFIPGDAEKHRINQNSFAVTVPAGSAAVITIDP
ncbi:MAG TPA: glycosyl hydrolase family 79 C-terminal domain-containing protein [Mucilaginibacter sp.]|nr:glycosyl hydrolase family 79 C-terminal domain-containing protein [Mucilaginibacter sp.]